MAEGELLQRERAVSELVRRFSSGREAAAEVFVLGQAHTDFVELRSALVNAKRQAQRLRARGVALALPDARPVASLVSQFITSVEADVGAVGERADVHRALGQYVQTYETEVRDATRAHVDQARSGVDEGVVELLGQAGLGDAAARLESALGVLLGASRDLPYSDAALDKLDEAAAELRQVMSALDDAEHAHLLAFVQRLVASGGSVSLDTIDASQLEDLKSSGAATNFIVSARRRF